ncbi:MAG: ATP-binding cassette domain-containing protein [Planctomycetes bacterium]|nr:ATP-binding cassette domain-containing protein [Planctomycetota bacterium]
MKIIMQLDRVDKSFGGVHAIDHLSFDIYEGEILGLIGPNGAGKSTCVNIISGVYSQDSGSITFYGEKLRQQSIPDRAFMGIGRTFQSPKPFEGLSIRNNVLTAALLYNKHMKDAEKATDEILELTDFSSIRDLPAAKLPIEKRKWLDMARVLAIRPKLLMLDECLAGLTPAEMDESLDLVKRINATGVTILFIEHVMAAVTKLCPRVVVLNEGAFLSQGDTRVVMREKSVIKAYLGEDYEHVEN